MGAASCKNSKAFPENQQKEDKKNITIGVFGLDDAGKTSTVKAIEGEPTDRVLPTVSSTTTTVKCPLNEKNERNNKNKNQQSVRIIDVSGERRFRRSIWPQHYDEIHGLIFVIDASDRDRLDENQETLEDLLENEKLKNKPILVLANKQDLKGAIKNENDLKHQLNIQRLKTKHKIELCSALPQDHKNKVDMSIQKGFSWLIRTIDENYAELNQHVTKSKSNQSPRKLNQFESDEDDSDDKYAKGKNTSYSNRITSEKLPNIHTRTTKTKAYSDNDDDDDDDDEDRVNASSTYDFNKKKKLLGATKSNNTFMKKSTNNEPKAFRSTYESFPEETPWSASTTLKMTKSDDMLPRLNTKSSITSDTKRKTVSPLVHDTKSYTNGSLSKRDHVSDDDEDSYGQKSKLTNRFSFNTKKPSSSMYDDDYDIYNKTNDRRTTITSNKSYNRSGMKDDDDDDDDYNYMKTSTTSKSIKTYDHDYNKSYRGTTSKTPTRFKINDDDDDDDYSSSRKKAQSKFDEDDNDDYSKSKSVGRSTYHNDYGTSKTTNRPKYDDDDDDDDYRSSSTKPTNRSKFEDDDYPSSSKKPDYPPSYSHSYGSSPVRSRFGNDDFFTSNNANRLQKKTYYDN